MMPMAQSLPPEISQPPRQGFGYNPIPGTISSGTFAAKIIALVVLLTNNFPSSECMCGSIAGIFTWCPSIKWFLLSD
jgi:hypothetical protein